VHFNEALLVDCKEVGLEEMLIKLSRWSWRDQNAGRSHNIKIDNSSFEMAKELKYLGTTLTRQNSIQEEIKSRLKSGSANLDSRMLDGILIVLYKNDVPL